MHTERMPSDSLQFHIDQNDYFGTLATVLDQVVQELQSKKQTRHVATLQRLRDDLIHLQSQYRIEPGSEQSR
jgi:hypothetical protein